MMQHGADIYTYAKLANCPSEELIDFSSNINLYHDKNTISVAQEKITKYPDTNYTQLKNTIAKNYEIDEGQIALYNGATSAIYALFSQLKAKKVYLYAPLYGEYEKAAFRANKFVSKINRISDIENPPAKKSIVVFVNPSTPDGSYHDMKKLLKSWIKLKCTIILDESFLEFEALRSQRAMIQKYKKLYIIQSFSKFYACAGVRVGAIFAHKKSIGKLQKDLWSISALDSAFLDARLNDTQFKTRTLTLHQEQKKELHEVLEHSGIFEEIAPSDTNFLLCYTPRGRELFTHLLQHKILVRSCESFDYLSENWLRFAVKSKQAHQQLKEALHAFT
jgi:threonine-phosphate decarboxylase